MDNNFENDTQLWKNATFGAIPLKQNPQKLDKPKNKSKQEQVNLPILPPSQAITLPQIKDEYIELGDNSKIDSSIAKQLRNGDYPIDATLDLHGLIQDEAFEKLKFFVQTAFSMGKRCILVITGKGLYGEGTLRQQLPKWLNSPLLQNVILNISQANVKHGGEGAFYVILRRNRSL